MTDFEVVESTDLPGWYGSPNPVILSNPHWLLDGHLVPVFQLPGKKGRTDERHERVCHKTKQAAGAQKTETPGGDYALKRDDGTQMGVNAHAALPSRFARACGFPDRHVSTCPS